MTFEELKQLREKVSNDEIAIMEAKQIYFASTKTKTGNAKKAWHTSDWKKRRAEIVKEQCEICASKEVLTLQHKSHPRPLKEFENALTRELNDEYSQPIEQAELFNHVKNDFDYMPTPLCPKCKERNPNERMRKTPKYLCTICRHEFDEPDYKEIEEIVANFYQDENTAEVNDKCFISKNQYRNQQKFSQIRYWLAREKVKSEHNAEIEKQAFLQYLDDNIKYLSFEDTITACKKCAFQYDINNMEICPICNKFYKGIQYPSCIQCLPEDKKKAALEKIELAKEWQAMHEALGID